MKIYLSFDFKILLSLDPGEDPLAAILMVDFYALRAREYNWMVQLHAVWDKHRYQSISFCVVGLKIKHSVELI